MTGVGADQGEERPTAPSAGRVVHEALWFGIGQVANDVAFYAMVLVLAALLSPHAFGSVALGMAIVRVANLLTQAGIGGSVITARNLTGDDVRRAYRMTVGIAFGFAALIAALASPIAHTFAAGSDPDVLRALAFAVVLASAAIIPSALLRKELRLKALAAINAGAALGTAVIAIAAAVAGAGVWALVARQLVYQGLIAVVAYRVTRPLVAALPPGERERGPSPRSRDGLAFALISGSGLVAMTLDNVVVGAATDAAQLGFYSLAFTFGFAPLTQISWRLGQVLFPAAAATEDLALVGRRTLSILRITSLLLFPLVPVAIVLAPAVIPAVLGAKWAPMVTPFQILLVVGIAHAVTNTIGESLSGGGGVWFRSRIDVVWAVGTLALVGVFALADGIRGAALGHLVGFLPLLIGYSLWGTRKIGTDPGRLWGALRGIFGAVAAQAGVTAGLWFALDSAPEGLAATAAALGGLATALLILWRLPSAPFDEARRLVAVARSGRGAAAQA
ncbi:MAG: polysaccharide biosynthesis protein [Solirubrobacterales bacterium]|nr:polysaccharide biosynthesis protein [Solirubrobacterales bacterium]